ncbi:MAG TPA: GTP cyclohydrolase I FolE [Nitrososphaeraceae archaeon]|jgi:GTP cyclohydrolase I|nr:GTP cyclohydrolase I FolE [Thermoproteota archaeon]MDW0148936.1 GTP cyclohydrolase I FolE [Nitrososphaeraceae archaeon]MDW3629952.1 GTP cyclohydrolase I FolE [Nitrososphaeraceae archaeon]HEX5981085.1 GTP cyclohydrolase I FolE [Nitrososphaeraceae archaeon]HZB64211.1 GTP cyclohydrolase I FolE [Nitrososphaeraceae archaeon]
MTNSRVQKTGTINKNKIEKLIRQLLVELGENPNREGLIGTPKRIAEMYEEIFSGYKMNSELDVSFSEETNAIIARDIQFYSMCEHHMLPFYGRIHIAYVPNGKVFGLSKLVRLAEKYSRRMQIQERLTTEIADEVSKRGVSGVIVIAEGEHLCMKMRGVRNNNSIMTIAYRGVFEEKGIRENILNLIYTRQNNIINL